MAIDDSLHGRQADARARELAGGMQPLEDAEQFVRISHVEPGPIIAHEECSVRCKCRTDLNSGLRQFAGEFPGIAQQILKGHPQQMFISLGFQILRNDELHGALGVGRAQFSRDRFRN